MGRPKRDPDRPSTTERLVAAAEVVFAKFGFGESRLEDIAKAAGITRPSLLYHFGSKTKLWTHIVRRSVRELRDAFDGAASADASFPELVDALSDALVEFLIGHPSLATVLLRSTLEGTSATRTVVVDELSPLLDHVSTIVVQRGGSDLRPGLPVRQALLQVSAAALVHRTLGSQGEALWGEPDQTKAMARILFLAEKGRETIRSPRASREPAATSH